MTTTYQVRYRKLGATTWSVYGQPTSNLNQALSGLQPNTTYQLQILATNELGEVASSIVSIATTKRGPSAPPIPIVSAVTQSSVVLNWSASATGSLPIAYQPMFRVHNTGSYAAFGSPLTGQSVTVTGLTPNTSYDFEVVSSNSAGSAVSPVATASTLAAGAAPGAPTSLNLSNVQQTQVTLGWSVSASGNTPIVYQPQYRLHGSAAAFTNVPAQPISGNSQTITGLTAGTQYDFQVIAQNSIGNTTSSPLTASTAAATVAPGVPGTPTISAITTSGVTLTWTAPSTGTTPFTYQVQFRKSGTTGFANFGAAISGLTEAVTGLTPATGYDFQVLAINGAGSTASATASATTATVATLPSAPTGLAASSITQSGLSLSWTASASGTPPITYTPQFRSHGSGSGLQNHPIYYIGSVVPANLAAQNTSFDFAIVDPTSDGGTGNTFWTPTQVTSMRNPNGGAVYAYFDMGGAENFRYYYNTAQSAGILSGTVNSFGENSVQYWSATWMSIAKAWALKAINAGFDGIFLDVADCYTDPYCITNAPAAGGYAAGTQGAAGVLEIQFMQTLKTYCQGIKSGFLVMENAGEGLSDTTLYGASPRFVDVIDGALREQVIYGQPSGGTPTTNPVPINTNLSGDFTNLARIIAAGKPVSLVEYVDTNYPNTVAVNGGTVTNAGVSALNGTVVGSGTVNAINWIRQLTAAWNCGYYIAAADYHISGGPTLSQVDTLGITQSPPVVIGSAWTSAAPTTTTNQNLTNLTPSTTYDLQVLATNASGTANSSAITATTLSAGTTWDPANTTGTEFNLTNGNLTLTSKATTQGGSRSTSSRASSKWYAEVKPTLITGTQRVGFANPNASLLSIFGSTADSIGIDPSGNVRIGNVLIGTGAPWVANSVISLALDEVNSKLFYQVNGGGWGAAPAAGESGTQEVGTSGSGPVIDGPASAHLPLSQTFALTGITVSDTVWPHSGTAALNVLCTGGTVSMTLNGAAIAGSGTNAIHANDTDANIQAMIQTISYTAPGSGSGDTVTVEVFDQLGQHIMLTIPIRLDANVDPANNIGGFNLLTLNAGPYFLAYSDNSNGDSITANFGATPMAFAPPSGFFTWDGLSAAAPQNMAAPSVSGVTSSAATLNWVAPPIGATPFTYQPLYRVHGAANFITFGAPTSLLTTTVTGLAAGTNYDFAVTVSNASGSATSPTTSALTSSASVKPGQVGGAQSSGGNPNITGPQIGSSLVGQPLYVTGITLSDTTWPTTSNNTLAVSCTNGTVRMQVGGSNVAGSGTKTISYASTPGNLQAAAASLVYTAPASGTADSIVVKLTDQGGTSASITVQLTLVLLSSGAPTSDFTVQLGTIGTTSIGLTWTAPSSPATATPTVFDTEFDTFVTHRAWQSPDPWGYCATVTQDGRGGPSFGEAGQQWWTNPLNPSTPINNLYIDSGGILQLGVDNTPSAYASYINGQAGATMPYVACLLNNQNTAYRQFGYYELKLAVPKIPGFCFQFDLEDYPATPTWNLEIDLSIGTDGSNVQSVQLRLSTNAAGTTVYTNTSLDFTQSHVYGLNWQSDFITLYIDGSQVYQTPTNTYGSVFTTSSMFGYLLTAANYQQAAVNPNPASLPAYAQVDYFRIYATKPAAATGGAISYAVQYRISGTFPWTVTSQTTAQAETITGLNLATSYDFQVGGSNTAGIGYSNIITGVTNQQTAANPLPGDTTGTTADRIADLMELFGVNTFSSTSSTSNTWGTFPSDYSQQSVINALNFLTAGSGLVCNIREYHYAGKEQWQATWCPAVFNATDALFTMAIGANGSDSDVASMMAMADSSSTSTGWMRWAEGNNEPNNNNFGSGVVPAATTVTVQQDIFTRCQNTNSAKFPVAAVGPSLIFGLPNPETGGPLAGYLNSTQLGQVSAAMSLINVHFYPSANPDVDDNSGRGGEFDDVKLGLNNFWGARPQILTEGHPTLFATDGSKGNDAQDAYRQPIFLLNAHRLGYVAAFWYALYDWQDSTQSGYLKVGLWPNNFGQAPRPVANTLAAMYKLTGDLAVAFPAVASVTDNTGAIWTITSGGIVNLNGSPAGSTANAIEVALATNGTIFHENSSSQWYSWTGTTWNGPVSAPTITASTTKRSFAPSKLNYTVSGLPAAPSGAPNAGGHHRLYQNSSGRFFLYVWNEQTAMSTAKVNVTVNFPSRALTQITEYNVSAPTATTSGSGAGQFSVVNGRFIAPDGQIFRIGGLNVYNNSFGGINGAGDFATVHNLFPKANMIRIAYQTGFSGNAENDTYYINFINAATASKVVCIVEDHSTISTWEWSQAQINTYASLASRYKANPYVWFESFNEPLGPNGSMTEVALIRAMRAMYDAVRGAGNNNIFLMNPPGGSYFDLFNNFPTYITGGNAAGYVGSGPGATGSQSSPVGSNTLLPMKNVGYDYHFYPWIPAGLGISDVAGIQNTLYNGPTPPNQPSSVPGLNGLQAGPRSADGVMPVVVGEWGTETTTDGSPLTTFQQNFTNAMLAGSPSPNFPLPGHLAWNWSAGGRDQLVSGNSLTSWYGVPVATWCNSFATQVGATSVTTGPTSIIQQVSNVNGITIGLDTSVHLLAIDY